MRTDRSKRWFSDEGKHLDRFGLVLGLSAMSVAVLSLIDLDDGASGFRSEVGTIIVTVTVGLTLVVALSASGVARRPRRIANIFIGLVIGGTILFTFLDVLVEIDGVSEVSTSKPSLVWTLIASVTPIVVLRRIMKHDRVTVQTLFGSLAVYLLLALVFNYAFLGVDNVAGGDPFFGVAETSTSFMYFSLTTLTTVGFGDLAAVSDVGRFLASAEAVLGQVLLVTVVARLVSLYSFSASVKELSDDQAGATTVE
ncbi:MAG: potassium channel family protein [Actinomycetia bacterium]|nr:potassium channel family protein [Actinomycetes bacterium]